MAALLVGGHVLASSLLGLLMYTASGGGSVARLWMLAPVASVTFVLGTVAADLLVVWMVRTQGGMVMAACVSFVAHTTVYAVSGAMLFAGVADAAGLPALLDVRFVVGLGWPGLLFAVIVVPPIARAWLDGDWRLRRHGSAS